MNPIITAGAMKRAALALEGLSTLQQAQWAISRYGAIYCYGPSPVAVQAPALTAAIAGRP